MSLSLSEQFTLQFYEWEQVGRGWNIYSKPVDIEPPYTPFSFHAPTQQVVDDGRVPSLYLRVKNLLFGKNEIEVIPHQAIPQALPYEPIYGLRIFTVTLPKQSEFSIEQSKRLLDMLSICAHPISFEIVATSQTIRLQFVCRDPDALQVFGQLKAYFPDHVIQETRTDILGTIESGCASIIDLGLQDEFMRPISVMENSDMDGFIGLFGMLDGLQEDEQACIQVLFKGAVDPWPKSIINSVTGYDGRSFFADAPEMPKLAREKISAPLFGVVLRAIGISGSRTNSDSIARQLAKTLCRNSESAGNRLIPLSNEFYPLNVHVDDVLLRESHRLGMLLNSDELSSFVHIPSVTVAPSKLVSDNKKTNAIADAPTNSEVSLGKNIHQFKERNVGLSGEHRLRHTHVIGVTGTGKTTLLQNLIIQDLQQGRGIAVLDPHGDLVETILGNLPKQRQSEVIVIDPADAEFPIGFNILTAHTEIEKEVLSSDLVASFHRLSTSWGDQMNSVLANAIMAFLNSSKGGTLLDLRRFLIEPSFRETFLKTVNDASIVYYWKKEYPLLKSSSIGSIITRLDTFLRPKVIRNMVAQNKGLDFESILNTNKILLVKLSHGLIGKENSYLLGTFIVSKIYQAAMARQVKSKEARNNFYLYVDEFQNFITPSMGDILSGARKYHLGLVLAHQDMQQLVKTDADIASSVISNAGTRICFRVGDTDAKRFEDGFTHFDAHDLQNLGIGEAIARIGRKENDFNLSIPPFHELPKETRDANRETIIGLSRQKYGTPKAEVEASLHYLIKEDEPPIVELSKEMAAPVAKPVEVIQPNVPPSKEVSEHIPVEITNSETVEQLAKQRELSQHRYTQTLIKRMAEARGYKASIEEPTPDGEGRVDVLLLKDKKRIACEIGVTTSKEWELHNIQKCLAAGYELVVAICQNKKAGEAMKVVIEASKISQKNRAKILVMETDDFFAYLDQQEIPPQPTEKRIKGYRVKVDYAKVSAEDMQRTRDSVSKVVVDSLKKSKQ